MFFSQIVQIAIFAIFLYSLILLFRVLLSWFYAGHGNAIYQFLFAITEPYLKIFRKFKILHYKGLDFSAIAAFIVLYAVQYILYSLTNPLVWTPFGITMFIYQIIWSFLSFVVTIVFIGALIRLIGLLVKASPFHPFWQTLDGLMNPLVHKLAGWAGKKSLTYRTALIITLVETAIVYVIGSQLIPRLLLMLFL